MISKENLDKQIRHYQNELSELYSLLKTLENPIFLKKYNTEKKDLTEIKNTIKYLLFFLSCSLDILVSLKALFETELDWERKFHIKNGLIVVYEAIKTFNKHQKGIRLYLDSDSNQHIEKLDSISLKIRNFKKKYKYETEIVNFRNKAGAHFDEKIDVYMNSLNSIDKPTYVYAINEFGDILDELLILWKVIVDKMVK